MNTVLIVDKNPSEVSALFSVVESVGFPFVVAHSPREALKIVEEKSPALVILDGHSDGPLLLSEVLRRKPGTPIIMTQVNPSVNEIVLAMRHGAVDFLSKPLNLEQFKEKLLHYIKPIDEHNANAPVAEDAKSQALMSITARVAHSDVAVLITGESGTGKEVLAHYIHDHSLRQQQPFIAINCAAIPEQMLEATLFGYEKGAFTGAYKSTPGKFEQAQQGTLLLDEISEMSLALQAKLLRVLQEKEVERIGSNQLVKLDVRIIATSNRCLQDEIQAGRFREDLYYRINVFPLHWLPLRERPDDIIPLAKYIIRRHCQNRLPIMPVLTKDAESILLNYAWPGNARELDNVIQRAIILQSEGMIDACHLQLTSSAVEIHQDILEKYKPIESIEIE